MGGLSTNKVKAPKTGGLVTAVAVVGQILYSTLGLLAGLIVFMIGALLVVGGFSGQSDVAIKLPGSIEMTVNTVVTGVVFAVLGAFVFWVSRYEVELVDEE